MEGISVFTYKRGKRDLLKLDASPDRHEPLEALAIAQHAGESTLLAELWSGTPPFYVSRSAIRKALSIEGDAGADWLAHSAMRQLSEHVEGSCGVIVVQATRFPLDMNRKREKAITPSVMDEGLKQKLLKAYDETRDDILRVLRGVKPGGIVFDVHTMWPWNLKKLPPPEDITALLARAAAHVTPDNWESARRTMICMGDLEVFPRMADLELFEVVTRHLLTIGHDFGENETFAPAFLNETFTGELYLNQRVRALVLDVPKHELHAGNREGYARAPWDAHLSDEKVDKIGGALARAAASVLRSRN